MVPRKIATALWRFFVEQRTHVSQISPRGRSFEHTFEVPMGPQRYVRLRTALKHNFKRNMRQRSSICILTYSTFVILTPNMTEIEIRGRLTKQELETLKSFLEKHGKHTESHNREMILLRGYPGYSEDFVTREVDIRLRNTDGNCEIMLKRKVSSEGNDSRSELALPLQDTSLENAKEIAKAFGCSNGILMHRSKDIYIYKDIEWSLVRTPKGHYYYEAEIETEELSNLEAKKEYLVKQAKSLGLEVLGTKETRDFVRILDAEVNEEITL